MKKKKINLSIKASIFASLLTLTVLMLIILWSLQAVFFGSLYKATKEHDVERASNLITDNIDSSNINVTADQIAKEYGICIKIYEYVNAKRIYSSECSSLSCIVHQVNDFDLFSNSITGINNLDSSEESDIFIERKHDEDGTSLVILSRKESDSQGKEFLLVLSSPVEPMKTMVSAVRMMLGVLSVLILLFALIIAFVLSKRLSNPIVKMNNNAKKLARANYDVHFDIAGPREIKQLASTLNYTTTELGKLDSMQKELIANISHDLRTPLTMISGYAEVMRDIPDENTPENLQVIVDESARLTSLVNDLLNVSKLQAGTQTMNIQRMNLTKAVLNTVERYSRFKEHNDFNIYFEYDREVYINADEIRLLQVIYNLINNAINYTGADKTVVVSQTVENGIVRISVKDSGEGIKEEDLPLIWDRYYKVDKIHKRAVIGTGLGLSIVKNILLLHGSRFGVSSELRKGSIFWFEFKISD